jgi:hypothetical protein
MIFQNKRTDFVMSCNAVLLLKTGVCDSDAKRTDTSVPNEGRVCSYRFIGTLTNEQMHEKLDENLNLSELSLQRPQKNYILCISSIEKKKVQHS